MKNKKKLFLFLAIIALIVLCLQAWDDEKLFTTIHGGKGKSNVVFVQDRTGSMCSIIYHPDFNVKDSTLDTYSDVDISNNSYEGISQTSWYIRWAYNNYIRSSNQYASNITYSDATKILRVGNHDGSFIKTNDWILQYDSSDPNNLSLQMVARVTNKADGPNLGHPNHKTYDLTLADIKGQPMVGGNFRIYTCSYNNDNYKTKIVKLYGSSLDQESSNDYYVSYGMDRFNDKNRYLIWIFGRANDTQRQQVTDFSTLAYDIEYNGYLRTTPVRPDLAYALNPDNSNSSVTLLAEWNSVMKDIYPNRVANLQNDPVNATATTINYYGTKDSFKNYTAGGFYIKIDAETMLVNTHTPSSDPLKPDEGQMIVTRGQNNTVAATHLYGSTIMIYNNAGLGIDESTPEIHLFSSMQHVVEATGDVDPTFKDLNKNINGTYKDCYRYKRVFTRIQVAREALCDVVTAKNKLLKIADLATAYSDVATDLIYCNVNPGFLTRVAPFYIKVSDTANPGSDEIMLVTAHDPATYTLTVIRGQKGTSACAHNIYSGVLTYSGARDLVRFGIFTFTSDPDNPAAKIVDLNDFGKKDAGGQYLVTSTQTINDNILDQVDDLRAKGSTPLARALAYVWNYLKPNPGTGVAGYIDTTNYNAVDQNTFGTNDKFETIAGDPNPRPKGSPMEYHCQENFAVLITDGDSNQDSPLTSLGVFSHTSMKTTIAAGIISDFFRFDYNHTLYGPSRWGDAVNDVSEYLTDVAYFLSHQDMFPTTRIKTSTWDSTNYIYSSSSGTPEADTRLYNETDTDPYKQWPGNQTIKTYTVGLCLANTVLPKAAKNGGGASFTTSNYRDLSEAFLNIITSVELSQEPTSYTTYAAPKQSITGGKYGYIAHFNPRERAMWEGHLRRYRLSDTGAFPDDIDNPAATVSVGSSNVVSFQWDAGVILNTRTAARVVYTSKPSAGIWSRYDFMGSGITYTDLDVTSAQVTQVKNFIQNFNKVDGINANSDYNNLYRLGETFHFNPQLVGYPLAWKADLDLSYQSFYNHYADDDDPATPANPTARAEVVYTGANDGKLHCFQASNGSELWSYIPFAQLKSLKEPALNPLLTTAHTYFIDGKSLVKDIKVAKAGGGFYNDYRDWKTGIFFGMGIGGRSYCALDVTNPSDPTTLWEINDSAETEADGRMGFTEAKPVVVDMNAGSTLGNFPGAILAGGYNAAEVQATDTTAQDWQRREGKALYILNANSGALIKKFVYGTAASNTATLNTIPGFLTAMTAAPAVFDKNNDGIADVIYLAESGDYKLGDFPTPHGGAIWKIKCYGDPINWAAQKIYQAPEGQTIFVSPSLAYDADYRVWVMFGTGRRSRPAEGLGTAFTNLTGQFVAFIDDGSGTTITNADLHNAVPTSVSTDYTINDSGTIKKGFFFDFLLANEIMYEPQPLYINKTVYFMTFVPRAGGGSTGATDDPCGGNSAVNGSHYIYQFKLSAQGNTFTIGDFLNQSGKILGYGPMDDTFTIYVGPGDAGTFESIEANRINEELENNNNAMLWKEDKK